MKSDLNFNLDDIIEEAQSKKKKNSLENNLYDINKNNITIGENTAYLKKESQNNSDFQEDNEVYSYFI